MRSFAIAALVLGVGAAVGVGGRAWADKKKPGLFDFSTWKAPVTAEREAVEGLMPVPLDVLPLERFAGPVRAVRLRVYADRDYRSGVLRWKLKFRAQIDRINRVVQPLFNARFEIESLREWDRSHAGVTMEPIITDLEAADPATDVEWVIGLVTPFRGVATSIHQIGGARLLARHFVMRAMDDEEEARAMDQVFKLLSVDERERVYGERKTHKEMVIFLHEWGHTMGLQHAEDRSLVMNPMYDSRQTGFTEQQKRAAGLVIDRRLATPAQPYPETADLLALLQSTTPETSPKEHEHLLELLRARLDGKSGATRNQPGAGTAGLPALNIPGPDVDAFNRAVNALNDGQPADAWTLLAPLIKKHAAKPEIAGLACHLLVGHPKAADARTACDAAAKLSPRDPRPLLDAAATYVHAKDLTRATPLALAAGERARAPNADADAKTCLRLAQLLHRVGALTDAEAALVKADRKSRDAQKVTDDIETTRRRLALPRDGARIGVPPEKEPAYAGSFWEAAAVVAEQKPPAARAHLTQLSAAYPQAPGVDVLWCELELRAAKPGPAVKRCTAGVAKFDEAVRAHFLLGLIAIGERRDDAAEKHLRQAILLDPGEPGGWRELVRLYRMTRAKARLAELSAKYNALFGKPLPE